MTNEEIEELLSHLKELVARDAFYTVLRGGRKVAIKNELIKKVVPSLKVSDFNKKELDYNGSGEYIFVFITQEGMKFYIKFKFVFNKGKEKVKFISFHYAELRNA
ncbi:type II toxin-antitoxin system MqsR family toxin [Streptococcus hyointestinalis]|uniref:Phage protein n=1 Tax=Streptococcus hyointestinalis TaxID=1337 RepID=A0A380JZS5_9STRE|nr:type II toxin-antitoxin system MqsR family toxin [Streptococcus hyointestinalis]SUN58034.1 Uncharacterised protein [Streptococcus hyointestinalis]